MKTFKEIQFIDIELDKEYVLCITKYEEFDSNHISCLHGTGQEVIDHLKEVFDYDDWFNELDSNTQCDLLTFLDYAEDRNGDGNDYIQVLIKDEE